MSPRKRKLSTPCVDKKHLRRKSFVPNMRAIGRGNPFVPSKTRRSNGTRKEGQKSPTVMQNNHELATALSKARSRITELENGRFQLQSELKELREKYCRVVSQLQKLNNENTFKKDIDSKMLKETCGSLCLKMRGVNETLLESSAFLLEVEKSLDSLPGMMHYQSAVKIDQSSNSRTPLTIHCDDSLQRSQEAALSITKLTPSSGSSSESFEMASPDPSGFSPVLNSSRGLLTTKENGGSEITVSADEKYLPQKDNLFLKDFMDMDLSVSNCCIDSPVWRSTPTSNSASSMRLMSQLSSTPEDCEVNSGHSTSRYLANHSMSSPHFSPPTTLSFGRRSSRRNVMKDFGRYTEPSLISKLRQGDRFTDCSLYAPQELQKNKRKRKQSEDVLKKKKKKV